jgi:hypothetical protein
MFALSCDQAGCSNSTEEEVNELKQSHSAIVTYVGAVYGLFNTSYVELIDWMITLRIMMKLQDC